MAKRKPMKKTKTRGLWVSSTGYYSTRVWREGKTRWVSLGPCDSDAEAVKRLKRVQEGLPPAEPTDESLPKPATLGEAVRDWLATSVATRRNVKGQKLAVQISKMYLLDYFPANTLLSAVTRESIQNYRKWLDRHSAKLSPNSVTHVLSDLRAILNWCADTGRLDRSPFPRRVMPRVQQAAPKSLTPEEVRRLTTLQEPIGWTLRFLLGTGLRWANRVERGQTDGRPRATDRGEDEVRPGKANPSRC